MACNAAQFFVSAVHFPNFFLQNSRRTVKEQLNKVNDNVHWEHWDGNTGNYVPSIVRSIYNLIFSIG